MAPEVGRRQAYNVSADVYSWAMVCYEVLVGKKPFADWTRCMLEHRVWGCGERPATAHQLPSTTIRSLLEAGWDQDAHQRPAMQVVEETINRHVTEQQRLLQVSSASSKPQPQEHPAQRQQQVTMEQHSCVNSRVSCPNNHPPHHRPNEDVEHGWLLAASSLLVNDDCEKVRLKPPTRKHDSYTVTATTMSTLLQLSHHGKSMMWNWRVFLLLSTFVIFYAVDVYP